MTEAKKKLDAKIQTMLSLSPPLRFVARRLFLYDSALVFANDQERGFSILNAVCEHFKVPFSSVRIVGSAQTTYTYYKERDFVPGTSDLDVAIVNSPLFQYYSQEIYWLTRGYSDLTQFPRPNGISTARGFRDYLSEGYFRPDLMPNCAMKTNWFGFFNRLTNNHAGLFSSINAGIYLSEGFFEMKNSSIVEEYRKAKE
jgi:hypothetical protein